MALKTVRFTRLVQHDFNCGTWLKEILSNIRFNEVMVIHVGFSFIANNGDQKIYLYCAKALAPYMAKCLDKNDALNFADELELKKPSDHLTNTFLSTDIGDPFHTPCLPARPPYLTSSAAAACCIRHHPR